MQMSRRMTNLEVARVLRAVAAVYQLKDEARKRFEIIAYREAADSIESLSTEIKDIWDEGRLDEIPGVGEKLAGYLDELFRTGKVMHFEKILNKVPEAIFPLMDVSGIGPKTAYKLVNELGITNNDPLKEVEQAARERKIETIEGFGEKSQQAIIQAIEEFKGKGRRFRLNYALERAEDVVRWMKENPNVKQVEVLGSLRRREPTIGDVDIAIATDKPVDVTNHFVAYPKKTRLIEEGPRKASILMPGDVQADLRVQEPESFGALLQHFTGSKAHNIAVREYAQKKGLSLSEYGIKTDGGIQAFSSEEEFYQALGMQWMPPEIRQNTGEIEAAIKGTLPMLVNLEQIKGDLQIHSSFDIETSHDLGMNSMEEIVEKANSLGYEYIAFTEHNPAQRGHTPEQVVEILKRKAEKVQKLNQSLDKNKSVKRVFNSLEIDILPDGSLPVPEAGLELLDFALVSIHSSFRQPKEVATKRVLRAMEYPKVKIFAHPTGRKVMEREGVELDWEKIFAACVEKDMWLEINADPARLDLPDTQVREAIGKGIKLTIGTDAHSASGMENMRYGVYVARRGWAEAKDIMNTRSAAEIEKALKA